ncbi:hypothetical protein [Fischerella muscicola]|nr:hypothetical protein [Fischerella muscicola]
MGRWGDGELTGPHSPKGVGIRGSGEMGRWGDALFEASGSVRSKDY